MSYYPYASPVYMGKASGSVGGSPPAWASPSVDTDASDFSASSPPASDDGFASTHPMGLPTRGEDWDLLSEMLIDDAVSTATATTSTTTTTVYPGSFLGGDNSGYDTYGAPPKQFYDPQHQQIAFQQQYQQQQPRGRVPAMPSGFMDALLMQDDALMAARAKSSAVGSPQTTDLFPSVVMPPLPNSATPSSCGGSSGSDTETSPSPSPQATQIKARKTSSSTAVARADPSAVVIKQEKLTPEEAKKLRRRSQIASSVQRHREKKKCLVASLKQDLTSLTAHLESLRSQRKVLHSNNEKLVEWEEEAITQRRKRKQSEELNQRMKKALFQQTCFLMGMRSIMTNIPAPREMHIHDWLHTYTVLSSRDIAARQKECLSYFSDSKIEMAQQIVLRETDVFASRVTPSNPYYAEVRVLHDGTEVIHHEEDIVLKKELNEQNEYVVPGSGQVIKKYTSMFLFEERGNCTIDAFKHVALEATKSVGVFWPSSGYSSKSLDTFQLDDSSQIIFSDLHGSMSLVDDRLTSEEQDVQLEARMICRVKNTDDDCTIVWDYADKDELYPIEGDKCIRRDSCGGVLVRREPGGKISFRSVCVKMFGPMDSHETASNDVRALTQRRISLQASELERQNQKCTRSIYESLAAAFTRSVSIQNSA